MAHWGQQELYALRGRCREVLKDDSAMSSDMCRVFADEDEGCEGVDGRVL